MKPDTQDIPYTSSRKFRSSRRKPCILLATAETMKADGKEFRVEEESDDDGDSYHDESIL